ncbi:MAG: hypothetical protein ACOYKC_09110 [Anaerolineaceae bacterium]|jgi:hypothetical protein
MTERIMADEAKKILRDLDLDKAKYGNFVPTRNKFRLMLREIIKLNEEKQRLLAANARLQEKLEKAKKDKADRKATKA